MSQGATPPAGGPAAAGVEFPFGWAHETPRLRGVSELAMSWLATTPAVRAGWQVDALTTRFWVDGSPDAARRGLIDALRRIEQPPELAEYTDPNARQVDPDAELLFQRWGWRSFGLQAFPRMGWVSATTADVAALLATVSDATARLYVSEGTADLDWLPRREATALPDPWAPPRIEGPVRIEGWRGGVALSWLLHSPAPGLDLLIRANVSQTMQRALDRRPDLPRPGMATRSLGRHGVHSGLVIPAELEQDTTPGLVEALRRWSVVGPEPAELSAVRVDLDEAPDADGIRTAVQQLLDTILVLAPTESPAAGLAPTREPDGAGAADPDADGAGRVHELVPMFSNAGAKKMTVRVGAQGMAARDGERRVQVARDEVALLETWPGGSLRVTSRTGGHAHVETAAFLGGAQLAEDLIALAPNAVVAHPSASPTLATVRREYQQTAGATVAAIVVMAPFFFALTMLYGAVVGVGPNDGRLVPLVLGLVMAVASFFGGRRAWRLAQVRSALKSRFGVADP
ncbi:MAG: hypothetical protein WCF36_01485 [Candidatus Nanopelagicales bacterium]